MKPAGPLVAALGQAIVPLLAAAGGAALLGGCGSCQSTVRTTAMPVIAAGSFDAVVADQPAHRLYLADRTAKGVDVVDVSTSSPRFVSTIPLAGEPNGLAVASGSHRLFAALTTGGVAVVDTSTMAVAATIPIDSPIDLIDYSDWTDSLYAGSGATVLVIDVATRQVTRRLTAPATVEQPRYDPTDGKVYATVPRTDELLQIDPLTGYVTRTYVVGKCRPRGLGINASRQLAMLACGSSVALIDLKTGAQQVTRAVQGGDVVTYDATGDRFVVASPHEAQDSAVGVFAGDGSFLGSVASTPQAHAAAYDSTHGLVYAPSPKGLTSFAPAACAPTPDWLKFLGGLSVFAAPLLAAAVFLWLYARRRSKRRGGRAAPTFHDLQEEDLEQERERMRDLEDGILGPEGG